MKAITLTQPWASLVACGAKRIETRSWSTRYREPLAVHAAANFPKWAKDLCIFEPFASALRTAGIKDINDLPRGKVIAVVHLVNCQIITAGNVPGEPECSFGDYRPGRFAWFLSGVKELPECVPAKESLGLWEWPAPEGVIS